MYYCRIVANTHTILSLTLYDRFSFIMLHSFQMHLYRILFAIYRSSNFTIVSHTIPFHYICWMLVVDLPANTIANTIFIVERQTIWWDSYNYITWISYIQFTISHVFCNLRRRFLQNLYIYSVCLFYISI